MSLIHEQIERFFTNPQLVPYDAAKLINELELYDAYPNHAVNLSVDIFVPLMLEDKSSQTSSWIIRTDAPNSALDALAACVNELFGPKSIQNVWYKSPHTWA